MALGAYLRGVAAIPRRLRYLEHHSHGARATFVGNNRVLVKIVIDGHNIAYFVEADDLILSPWFIVTGTYETNLTNYFVAELKRDSHCLDIGANFGFFTCLMARFCPKGQILAVEPDTHVYPLLRDNIAINGFGHAAAVHAAASDRDRQLTLYRRSERSANTSMIQVDDGFTASLGEQPVAPFDIKGIPVDILAERLGGRVDFIKIDVEGAEPLVIAGARDTIADNAHIVIVMEWSPGQVRAAGFDLGEFADNLKDTALVPFDPTERGLQQLSYDELLNLPYRAGIVLKRI